MVSAEECPFLAADLAAGKREIMVRPVPPPAAENSGSVRAMPRKTRKSLEAYFTRALNAWPAAVRRA